MNSQGYEAKCIFITYKIKKSKHIPGKLKYGIGCHFWFSLKRHFSGKSKNKICCDIIIWLSLLSKSINIAWKEAGSSCMTPFQSFLCGIFLSFRKPIDMYIVVLNVEWIVKHGETQRILLLLKMNVCLHFLILTPTSNWYSGEIKIIYSCRI